PLRRVSVRNRDVEAVAVLRLGGEQLRELLERLLPPTHASERDDHAVLDGEDRLHVEQRARERLRLADPPALLQVLERGDREDDAVRALEPLDQLRDLLVRRPVAEAPVDRLRE